MRDRLIEILSKPIHPKEGVNLAEVIADYLLDNGVIVPPCKVGDTVYYIPIRNNVIECKVATITIEPFPEIGMSFHCYGGVAFDKRHLGEFVFLTREEAEKALAERRGE